MKKILLVIMLLIAPITISGCEEKEDCNLYDGLVAEKIFTKAHSYTTYTWSGKIMIPVHHYVPDQYYIVIYKNEKTDKHRVSKEFYDNCDVGSIITITEEDIIE